MRFDELDNRMRVYETALDQEIPPGIHVIARLDGRSFSHLTRDVEKFEAPFDPVFRDHMVATVEHLMACGFKVSFGYTQSDEISLLFHLAEDAFGRRLRKWLSVLAGEASAAFSLRLGRAISFDNRLSLLANQALVVDYFRWRSADAHRNALNAHCYWLLRNQGQDPKKAQGALDGMSVAAKNAFLFDKGGINFNDLPAWQKRGIGFYWKKVDKLGVDPRTGKTSPTIRNAIHVEMELPLKEAFDRLLLMTMADAQDL